MPVLKGFRTLLDAYMFYNTHLMLVSNGQIKTGRDLQNVQATP